MKTLVYPVNEYIYGHNLVMPVEILDSLIDLGVEEVVVRTNTKRYIASIEEIQDAQDVTIDDRWNKTLPLSLMEMV